MIFLFSGAVTAGGNSGDFGFGLSAVESNPKFLFQWWVGENMTIEPSFGIILVDPGDRDVATRLFPGLGLAYHMRPGADLRPYIGARIEFDIITGEGHTADKLFKPAFGAQYFFSDRFAVSGEYQIVVVVTDDDGSPSFLLSDATYITSSQLLSVHFYF